MQKLVLALLLAALLLAASVSGEEECLPLDLQWSVINSDDELHIIPKPEEDDCPSTTTTETIDPKWTPTYVSAVSVRMSESPYLIGEVCSKTVNAQVEITNSEGDFVCSLFDGSYEAKYANNSGVNYNTDQYSPCEVIECLSAGGYKGTLSDLRVKVTTTRDVAMIHSSYWFINSSGYGSLAPASDGCFEEMKISGYGEVLTVLTENSPHCTASFEWVYSNQETDLLETKLSYNLSVSGDSEVPSQCGEGSAYNGDSDIIGMYYHITDSDWAQVT